MERRELGGEGREFQACRIAPDSPKTYSFISHDQTEPFQIAETLRNIRLVAQLQNEVRGALAVPQRAEHGGPFYLSIAGCPVAVGMAIEVLNVDVPQLISCVPNEIVHRRSIGHAACEMRMTRVDRKGDSV